MIRVFRGLVIVVRHSVSVDRPDVVLESTVLHATRGLLRASARLAIAKLDSRRLACEGGFQFSSNS